MIVKPHQNANGSVITITATATLIYDLINTAASTSAKYAGFPVRCDSVNIVIETDDVRYLADGNTPTAAKGILLKPGMHRLRGVDLPRMKLIRVGGSDVTASVEIGISTPGESSSDGADTEVTVTLPNEGQQTMANSISVAIASDQSNVPVAQATKTVTYAETTVGDSASSVTLLAANANRGMATIRNGSTANMYISKTATATTSSPVLLTTNQVYELPVERNGDIYKGALTAIWASDAGGSAYVEESTLS